MQPGMSGISIQVFGEASGIAILAAKTGVAGMAAVASSAATISSFFIGIPLDEPALKPQADLNAIPVRRNAQSQTFQFVSMRKNGNSFLDFRLAGAEGLEPSTLGFGDRCSTN